MQTASEGDVIPYQAPTYCYAPAVCNENLCWFPQRTLLSLSWYEMMGSIPQFGLHIPEEDNISEDINGAIYPKTEASTIAATRVSTAFAGKQAMAMRPKRAYRNRSIDEGTEK